MLTHGEATREIPLPFILKDKRGRVVSYWHAPSTGDWFKDSQIGDAWAFAYMEAAHRESPCSRVPPFVCIIEAMVKAGAELKGHNIAHAFLCTVANTSYGEWTPAVLEYHRKRGAENDAFIVKHMAEQAAERSQRARKAALAGAAKRRKSRRRRS